MRILNLVTNDEHIYSSNVYLIRGDWNAIPDVNTLVDVGNDPSLLDRLQGLDTGVGKRAVEHVILTHGHFDHAALVPALRELCGPLVYAHPACLGADVALRDGQMLRCGDRIFEVIYLPGHSEDSIGLYCQSEGVLFAGDAPLILRARDGSHEARFIHALERLSRKVVRAIYFGHGEPLVGDGQALIRASLAHISPPHAPSAPA